MAEHDAQVRSLESKQYSLGKALNEEQAGMTKKEAELVRAKAEQEEVGRGEIGEDEWIDSKASVSSIEWTTPVADGQVAAADTGGCGLYDDSARGRDGAGQGADT